MADPKKILKSVKKAVVSVRGKPKAPPPAPFRDVMRKEDQRRKKKGY